MPDSIECLFDVEKKRRADLLQFKGDGYSVSGYESVTLLDGGLKGAEAELVTGDRVVYKLS